MTHKDANEGNTTAGTDAPKQDGFFKRNWTKVKGADWARIGKAAALTTVAAAVGGGLGYKFGQHRTNLVQSLNA